MTAATFHGNFYIDLRPAMASEHISLDLSRHILCRMTNGTIIILATQPRIFCSVVRRRWKRIIQETELQACLTLNRVKKRQLREQIERLQSLTFSSKRNARCDVLVVESSDAGSIPPYATLYIAAPVDPQISIPLPSPKGLAVVYRPFWDTFMQSLNVPTQYGQLAGAKQHPSNSL